MENVQSTTSEWTIAELRKTVPINVLVPMPYVQAVCFNHLHTILEIATTTFIILIWAEAMVVE